MPIYPPRPGAQTYGHDIGVLLIECRNPFIPGDVGNATTYSYPVLYRPIEEVTIESLVANGDTSQVGKVIDAARWLEMHGVRAITSDCGYMLHFQPLIAGAVSIPVMLSSLLQLPFIASIIGPERTIGIICANGPRLTRDLLAKAYPNPTSPVFIAGLQDGPAFRAPILLEEGPLDSDAMEKGVVAAARRLVDTHPEIGALLLECSNTNPRNL